MSWDEWVRTLAAVATPAAVLVAVLQLRYNRRQAQADFEDDLSREYRGISVDLPLDAFFKEPNLDQPLSDGERKAMFRYFDLSNEQLRLGVQDRISDSTREAWEDGIAENMALPRFRGAWRDISPRIPDDFFTELDRVAPVASRLAASAEAE